MITLKQAMALCRVEPDELVEMIRDGQTRYDGVWFAGWRIRELFDMRKVYVVRIDTVFSYEGEYEGLLFTVRNVSAETLKKLFYAEKKGVRHGQKS